MSAWDHADFGAPAVVFQSESLIAQAEHGDSLDQALAAADAAMVRTNGDRREAALCLLERVRDDLAPVVRGPHAKARRVSQKAARAAEAAIDRYIEKGRGR